MDHTQGTQKRVRHGGTHGIPAQHGEMETSRFLEFTGQLIKPVETSRPMKDPVLEIKWMAHEEGGAEVVLWASCIHIHTHTHMGGGGHTCIPAHIQGMGTHMQTCTHMGAGEYTCIPAHPGGVVVGHICVPAHTG